MDRRDSLMQLAVDAALRNQLESTLGPFCHQFRNRLHSLKLALYLARRQAGDVDPGWGPLEADAEAIEAQLDRVQRVCREVDQVRVAIDLGILIRDRAPAWGSALAASGARLVLAPPAGPCTARLDVGRFGAGLDDLARWRISVRAELDEVQVAWTRVSDRTILRWTEMPANKSSSLGEFDPSETWTLPMLARTLADHGGALTVVESPGWELTMEWPDYPPDGRT